MKNDNECGILAFYGANIFLVESNHNLKFTHFVILSCGSLVLEMQII